MSSTTARPSIDGKAAERTRSEHVARGERVLEDVPLKALSGMTMNWAFFRRAARILYMGLGTPLRNPKLWLLILFDLAFQLVGAYILQSQLYILATGKDNAYPGISGCLRSGCGTYYVATQQNKTQLVNNSGVMQNVTNLVVTTVAKTIAAPGDVNLMNTYYAGFAWMFTVSMICLLAMSFAGDVINSIMRNNCANNIQRRLMAENKLMYRLTVDGTMDNVDQRITSDLQVTLDGFTCVLFGNSADYLAYPMWFAVGRISFSLVNCYSLPETADVQKQGQIIGIILLSVFIAFVAYILPINHVARIFFRGQRYEGDFRTTHTRAVLNCEQISMLRGERAERDLAELQYARVDTNNRIYYFWQGVLLILRLFVTITIPAVGYMCLAVTGTRNSTTANYFQKQAGDILEYILYFPVYAERLAYACGATHRVGQLLEQMDRFEKSPVETNIRFDSRRIELKGVFANPPVPMPTDGKAKAASAFGEGDAKKLLFEGVDLVLEHGKSLCIVGPSGCGKSSLLRVIAGLWGIEQGEVVRPESVGKGGIFFLPQKPYVFPGSLQAQIEYPNTVTEDDAKLKRAEEVLDMVHLGHLIKQYGMTNAVNWAAVLSISEMQRLNFARMFYVMPAFCLADECTSALELRLESFLYSKCADSNISMISVAHRPTVVPHHDFVFAYNSGTHRWNMVPSAAVATCDKFPIAGLEKPQPSKAPKDDDVEKSEGLNVRFFRRLCHSLGLGIGKCRSQGVLFLFLQVSCMCIYGGVTIEIFRNYGTSKIIAEITGTGGYARDVQQGLRDAGVIIGLNGVNSVVQSFSAFLGAILAVKVQRGIMRNFHMNYFTPGVVYHMNRVMREKGIDQRMVQDLSGMREAFAWLFGNPFAYCNYRFGIYPLSVAWTIMMGYAFSTSWQLTLFMLVFMLLSFLAQIFNSFFTSLAVGSRQRYEGNLRLHLGRVIQNIETITFFGGHHQEYATAESMLASVFRSRLIYNCCANATSIPTVTMYYWLQTGIYVMAAILQVSWAPGSVQPKDLFTTINFNIIWAKVTQLLIMCLGGLGMVIGFTHRVMHVVERAQEARIEVEEMQSKLKINEGQVVFDNVSIGLPTGDTDSGLLVQNLSFSVPPALCGAGHGKSSIMRALAGMWPTAGGTISRPVWGTDGIFFVPQSNYATQGTLAEQVVYPLLMSEAGISDDTLSGILEEVGMGAIVRRWGLHRVVNWDLVLSGGECQRLGFARALFHMPKIVVFDETTSALDMATEERCMSAVLKRNIIPFSFAARPSVANYHQQTLHVAPGGACTIEKVQRNQV